MYVMLILVLLIADAWMFYNYNKICEEMKHYVIEIKKNEDIADVANLSKTLLVHSVACSYKYKDRHIQDFQIEDDSGNSYMLSDVLRIDSPKMVFFFSYLNCESCVAGIFDKLEECCSNIDKEDIVVVGEFANRRAVDAYLSREKMPFHVYYKNESQHINILEDENMPFICIMTSDMITRDLMFPVKEVPMYLKTYIEAMKNKYFQKHYD